MKLLKRILISSLLCMHSLCSAGIVLDLIEDDLAIADSEFVNLLSPNTLKAEDFSEPRVIRYHYPQEISIKDKLTDADKNNPAVTPHVCALYRVIILSVDLSPTNFGTLHFYKFGPQAGSKKGKPANEWTKHTTVPDYTVETFKNTECIVHTFQGYKIYTSVEPLSQVVVFDDYVKPSKK